MYSKIKEIFKKDKVSLIESILNKGIYHLLYNTSKEVNDIEITIKKMTDELKKLL